MKRLLGAALVATLAFGLAACEMEKNPNNTVDEAAANNAFQYCGNKQFDGAGTLNSSDTLDVWVLNCGSPLPAGTYRVQVSAVHGKAQTNDGLVHFAVDGKWSDVVTLAQENLFCQPGVACQKSMEFTITKSPKSLRLRSVSFGGSFVGQYAFRLSKVA